MTGEDEKNTSLRYMPELDGLRAFAIIPVIFFHQHIPGFSLGWAGVFLFFVISGFLITGILLDSKDNPHYFRNFYYRRMLRIFPIYYIMFLALLCWGFLQRSSLGDSFYYVLYLQNMLLGYKSWSAQFPSSFNHTWSLAIEEQYYLVWPFLVYMLTKRRLIRTAVIFVIIALVSRLLVALLIKNASLVFTPIFCVMDSLSIGGLLAIAFRSRRLSRYLNDKNTLFKIQIISLSAILLIVFSHGIQKYWSPAGYLVGVSVNLTLFTIMAVFFGGLIATAIRGGGKTLWSSMLRWPWLRHIGKISYGLYLYHFPVIFFTRRFCGRMGYNTSDFSINFILVVLTEWIVTYLLALLSWHLIEKNFLFFKERFT